MSGRSSPAPGICGLFRFSLFQKKKRTSSVIPPSSLGPPFQHPQIRLDVPAHQADTNASSPDTTSHRPPAPVSSISAHDSAYQNVSSTCLETRPTPPSHQGQGSTYQGLNHSAGVFSGAHHFTMKNPVFVENNVMADNFMEKLLQHTIIGAEFDSSDRDPPPRCHPSTRLQIIQRCIDFIMQCQDEGKLRWVVGPAGVGKSAVMQMVAEKAPDGVIFVSIFLSVNGRKDGTKTILTIAYQLAVKCGPYRQFIQHQITVDPSLLRKSLSVQFKQFIVEPFMLKRLFDPSHRFLMLIDGLDECDNPSTQEELLELITDFCIANPTSPIVWIVASRPETHITSFFERDEVKGAYTKEEMEVNSDEACQEVQRYLRDELKKIQLKSRSLKHKREWPLEHEFTKIASSAGGLFAYAATVIRYIGDLYHRDPAAQLRRLLETIDAGTRDHTPGREHPMAQLDALYKRILSNIPDDAMINARKLLVACLARERIGLRFRPLCNVLGLTEDEAYGAVCHLHAVMKVPEPDKADDESVSYYHKSFRDFLDDFKRSGFPGNWRDEALQFMVCGSLRIMKETSYKPNDVAGVKTIPLQPGGKVRGCSDNIALSWPGDERFQTSDEKLRIRLYASMMVWMQVDFIYRDQVYGNMYLFHVLTTRFTQVGAYFPFDRVRNCAFETFRRELTELGIFIQVPLRTFNYATVHKPVELWFTSPTGIDVKPPDPSDPFCKYQWRKIGGLQRRQGWSTKFEMLYYGNSPEDEEAAIASWSPFLGRQQPGRRGPQIFGSLAGVDGCMHCSIRFARHFMNNQDMLATVFIDETYMCYVEFSFIDPDDGVSEWRYQFCHPGPHYYDGDSD